MLQFSLASSLMSWKLPPVSSPLQRSASRQYSGLHQDSDDEVFHCPLQSGYDLSASCQAEFAGRPGHARTDAGIVSIDGLHASTGYLYSGSSMQHGRRHQNIISDLWTKSRSGHVALQMHTRPALTRANSRAPRQDGAQHSRYGAADVELAAQPAHGAPQQRYPFPASIASVRA